ARGAHRRWGAPRRSDGHDPVPGSVALMSDLPSSPAVRRSLGLFDAVCVGVNGIVGGGVFAFPAQAAALLGPGSIVAVLFCALLCLPIASVFADLGRRFDRAGGPYLYARTAFGADIGFAVGWITFVSAIVSWAA